MTTSHPDNADENSQGQESLECLVAGIHARGEATPCLKLPPSPEVIAHLVEHVKNEQLLSPAEVLEWNKQWAAVEAEIRRIDEEDEAADRERDLDQNLKVLVPYIEEAMHNARYKTLDDGAFFGEIPGIDGVWASTATLETCRGELEDVLRE